MLRFTQATCVASSTELHPDNTPLQVGSIMTTYNCPYSCNLSQKLGEGLFGSKRFHTSPFSDKPLGMRYIDKMASLYMVPSEELAGESLC